MGHGRTLLRALAACLAALLLLAGGASAATLTLTVNDGGDASGASCAPAVAGCTLRSAIEQANATSDGTPVAIHFALGAPTITLSGTALPAITRTTATLSTGTTVIDGCAPAGVPPCVTLARGAAGPATAVTTAPGSAGITITGLTVSGFTTGVLVQGDSSTIGSAANSGHNNVFTGNGNAVWISGGRSDHVAGGWFGVAADGTTTAGQGNQRAIRITGTAARTAEGNVVGGPNPGGYDDTASCIGSCNLISGSAVAGVDLNGVPPDVPAGPGSGSEDFTRGTTVAGNWIGLLPDGATAAGNVTGIVVGDASAVTIGLPDQGDVSRADVISGNATGVGQDGTGALSVIFNLLGLDPAGDLAIPNTAVDATLAGTKATSALVEHNQFGPAPIGLALNGPGGEAYGNVFRRPVGSSATFSTAAIVVGPLADDAWIGGTAMGQVPFSCFPLADLCNAIGGTGPGAPGIWIQGADRTTVRGNSIGSIGLVPAPPLDGPPIRITDSGSSSSSGTTIGDTDPTRWNALSRQTGPAIDVEGHATGVVILDNLGFATSFADASASLFTDLAAPAGPGNTGPVNGGIQPPVITAVTTGGIAGTATPGATIRVLQQQRADDPADPEPGSPPPEGYTFPIDPGSATAAPDGSWSIVFASALPRNQKVMAAQTTPAGSSEYTVPQAATKAPDLPTVAITGGPAETVPDLSATFTFTTTTPGATFECGIDGGDLAPCSSPYTLTVDAGLHQFRVRARLGAAVGLPASRVWIVQPPAAAPPRPAVPSTVRPAVALGALATLPSNRRCISRRSFRIRLRTPKGLHISSARVTVNGRHPRTFRGRSLSAPVSLRGLPAGTVRVTVRVTLSDGRVVTGSRTYRTCARKKVRRG